MIRRSTASRWTFGQASRQASHSVHSSCDEAHHAGGLVPDQGLLRAALDAGALVRHVADRAAHAAEVLVRVPGDPDAGPGRLHPAELAQRADAASTGRRRCTSPRGTRRSSWRTSPFRPGRAAARKLRRRRPTSARAPISLRQWPRAARASQAVGRAARPPHVAEAHELAVDRGVEEAAGDQARRTSRSCARRSSSSSTPSGTVTAVATLQACSSLSAHSSRPIALTRGARRASHLRVAAEVLLVADLEVLGHRRVQRRAPRWSTSCRARSPSRARAPSSRGC